MCESYVHEKAKEVIVDLATKIEQLTKSRRTADNAFQGNVKIMIRRTIGIDGITNYLLFIVPTQQARYAAEAWEIIGSFDGLKQDLFYFITSKMYMAPKTRWFSIPFIMGESIVSEYGKEEVSHVAFINNLSVEAESLPG